MRDAQLERSELRIVKEALVRVYGCLNYLFSQHFKPRATPLALSC